MEIEQQIIVAGVDEAGRGPLAGPVVAAAVILDPSKNLIEGVTDSKKLTHKKRLKLFEIIKKEALAFAIGKASVEEIDKINILQASLLAMSRALESLHVKPTHSLIDGTFCPKVNFNCSHKAIVGGDLLEPAISAASILAKVTRDQEMILFDSKYPEYGFAKHKGYGTKQHMEALRQFGATEIHRRTFAPVRKVLLEQ